MKNERLDILRKRIDSQKRKLEFFRVARIVFILVLVCFFFLTVILRPVIVSGESMYPTLANGELAFTNVLFRQIQGIDRFDIVTVYDEKDDKYLVKRVIALPNETIEYKDDILYIDGKVIQEDFLDEEYIQKVTNQGRRPFTSDVEKVTLKSDEYFLVGDNRIHSTDSRLRGPFQANNIVSKDIVVVIR